MNNDITVLDFLGEFIDAFRSQLEDDQARWGDTWLHRTRKGQEDRIYNDYQDYWAHYEYGDQPIPWLKVIGNAYIAWIRENHPELFPE
jgi:hypothetical protein